MKATDKIDFRARDLAFNISVHREKIQGKNNYIISYTLDKPLTLLEIINKMLDKN